MTEFNNEALAKLRSDNKFTLKAVHEGTGIHGTDVSKYERGMKTPGADSIKRLADFFGVKESVLYKGKPDSVVTQVIEEAQAHLAEESEKTASRHYLSVPVSTNEDNSQIPFVGMFTLVDKLSNGDFLMKIEGKFYRASLTEL